MVRCENAGSLAACSVGSALECQHVQPHERVYVPIEGDVKAEVKIKDLCSCPCGSGRDLSPCVDERG
ncbi:MAG: hypothetical protein GWN94_24840 [Phycisphaerae bacterium]|nr:hypothetical protein [Phycisphaerae bacterium]NIS54281.1 hypothetical protein [Phycisphaerae bacterium]NIX29846.1 hypothetical protein [Phycisphaerae bacterium]